MSTLETRARRPALGRGLAALIPAAAHTQREGVLLLDIERVVPDPRQPRQHFAEQTLVELAQSIREQGVLQPILVRRDGPNCVIVAGERRWRAAQRAGLTQVPAIVRELSAADAFAVALVENLQREDLSPLEEAAAYQRLIEDHGLTQDQLAQRIGKDRSTIANMLRLLKLPEEVRAQLGAGALSMGHARALLSLDSEGDIRALARETAAKNLSVREVEARVRRGDARPVALAAHEDPNLRRLRETLQRALGSRVVIRHQGKGGRIEVHYSNLDELDQLIERITR